MKLRKVLKSYFKVKCRLLALIAYMLIGAAIFVHLEQTDEPNQVVANRILKAVQENMSLKFGVNITDQEFLRVVKNISEAVVMETRADWTFWKAIDFVAIALTTIGYGDITPRTPLGQGVFIIYALIGLPLAMVTLKYTGKFLTICLRKLIVTIEKKILGKEQHKHLKRKSVIVSLFLFVILHLYSAKLFTVFMKVSFLEGLYASFVSFSTIGFGDYYFNFRSMEKRLGTIQMSVIAALNLPLLLFNLSIVSCFLDTTVDMMEKVQKRISTRMRANVTTDN